MTKADIRTLFLAQRKALTEATLHQKSDQITNRFFEEFTPVAAQTIHIFLPIIRQGELNTWPIIERIWHHFPTVRVAVSVSKLTANQLTHHLLTPNTPLAENRWGIPEPVGDLPTISALDIDMVLVPLLAFDEHGQRVGYGKGYYDRFLAACRPDCQKIGLSLFDPVPLITDLAPTDVALDSCLTPTNTYRF